MLHILYYHEIVLQKKIFCQRCTKFKIKSYFCKTKLKELPYVENKDNVYSFGVAAC